MFVDIHLTTIQVVHKCEDVRPSLNGLFPGLPIDRKQFDFKGQPYKIVR